IVPIAAAVLIVPSLGIAGLWAGLIAWMVLRAMVNRWRVAFVLPPQA
ncbi:MAG: hypothetical protein IZT58_07140, partial [Actinobacteria bacterium]|nr:hypothetical protein [Actinomycetota bacterium]